MLENLTGSQIGILGGIIGTVLGCAGGAFGTYCSIKNTKGPLERKFMINASTWAWIAVTIFLVLLIGLPSPYRFLMWAPYGIMLTLGIRYINKKQAEIRTIEASHRQPPA